MATPPLSGRLFSLIEPAFLLGHAVLAFIYVFRDHLLSGDLTPLLKPNTIRDEAFSRFWLKLSDPAAVPSDPSQLVGSAALVPPLLAQVSGTVLEIGPGNGTQLRYFRNSAAISRIFAAEPATGLHAQLRAQAAAAGLADKYTVLACPADPTRLAAALAAEGVKTGGTAAGQFDSIVCVRVLCSVPDAAGVAANLHALLRPGGRLYVLEHVANPWRAAKGSVLARAAQLLYEALGWRYFVGDCELSRDTAGVLAGAAGADGGWASVEIDRHFGWSALPYIAGRYTKKA